MGTQMEDRQPWLRRLCCCFRSGQASGGDPRREALLRRTQYEKLEAKEDVTEGPDWELACSLGLGQPCEICGDEGSLATHAAPCGHSACEDCWKSWAQNRCMICSAEMPANSIARAPT